MVVARDGPLVVDYERWASVLVASHHAEPAEPVAAALRRAGHEELAQVASDRWLRHRLRRVGHHDLVHVNAASPATVDLLAHLPDSERSVPVVAHIHELDIGLRHNLEPEQLDLLLDRADHLVAVSRAVAENLVRHHGVPADRIAVHHGFVDTGHLPVPGERDGLRRRLGIGPDAFVVGSVGLPDWRKAPDLLLQVAWRLRRQHPEIDLHVLWVGGAGDAPDRWQLEDEAERLGLGGRAHFVPDVVDAMPHLGAMDLFALPSRQDAFPLAALEAATAGLPIVCFDTGGAPELVGEDAGVVLPYPDLDGFAGAVAELAGDRDRRTALGTAAAARVRARHDIEVAAPRLWADLRTWLAG